MKFVFIIVDLERYKLFPLICIYTEFRRLKEKFEYTTQVSRCEINMEFLNYENQNIRRSRIIHPQARKTINEDGRRFWNDYRG